jgi:excisionase family DNA binding protein
MIKLENKLYSSTEVAEILGVSLRSVYRYLEEGKLTAEVKTATGRHRFTRQNIVDFLYPGGLPEGEKLPEKPITASEDVQIPTPTSQPEDKIQEDVAKAPPQPVVEEPAIKAETQKVEPEKEEDQVDWLAKFREAAKKFEEATEEVSGLTSTPQEEKKEETPKTEMMYYRSRLGGLKDIAQNIDKTSRNSGLDYAFTLNAGLSLYKPINPFSLLHVYVRSKDRDFFERILALTPTDETNAQLCMITSDEDSLYTTSDEMHGLKVVDKKKLIEDISKYKEELLKEAEGILV